MTTDEELVLNVAKLEKWYKLKEKLAEVKEAEMALRMEIFHQGFPEPKEGTNKVRLGDGYFLKATYPMNRKIDIAVLTAIQEQLKDSHIKVDKLVKYEPELIIKGYRTLDKEELAIFDQCLIIKEGSPQLEIVKPKRA